MTIDLATAIAALPELSDTKPHALIDASYQAPQAASGLLA